MDKGLKKAFHKAENPNGENKYEKAIQCHY